MEPIVAKHIEIDPARCGGKPCIAGTRIRVWDVYVWHELQGRSAEEIVHDFPQLSLSDVHAALAYFWEHQEAIRRQMKEGEDLASRLRRESGPGLLDDLRRKDADPSTRPPR